MPETRSEWVLFALGLVAVVALVVAAVRARHHPAASGLKAAVSTRSAAKRAPPRTVAPVTTTAPARVVKPAPTRTVISVTTSATAGAATTRTATTTVSSTAPATTTASPAAKIDLTLRAARGDSWVEVRAGSSTAAVLYTGTLTSGTRKTFHARAPLWVRFGVAGNVDAVVNGRSLTMPAGTYSVLFDSSGYQHATG